MKKKIKRFKKKNLKELANINKNLKIAQNATSQALEAAENANRAKTDFYRICRMIFVRQ